MPARLSGKVCLVTGATRGIGKGIALQLAQNGAKVYITGRTMDPIPGAEVGGSLRETAAEIEARGGICFPVQCDHKKDEDIERLFGIIANENEDRLDVLVNNAYSGIYYVFSNVNTPFWEQPLAGWDEVNHVGLRNHYLCAVYAARMMVPRNKGLIVNISSGGGLLYIFGAIYGIGKAACDRMAADCGLELKKSNVAYVSLWPGYVLTDNIGQFMPDSNTPESHLGTHHVTEFSRGESPEFAGQCIVGLACDRKVMQKSGRTLLTFDLGREYRLKDKEGYNPTDVRGLRFSLNRKGYRRLAKLVPKCIRFPKWMMAAGEHNF